MEYKTQKSVIKDYQQGKLPQDAAIQLLLKLKKDRAAKKELKELNKSLNEVAFRAGFKKPK